jgi:SAM-dependent methyltransferase
MADHKDHDAGYWNLTARKTLLGQDYDEVMAEQYRWVHLELLARWVDLSRARSILKTDLFAEAMCPGRAFLWEMLKINASVTAMDLSGEICSRAGKAASIYAPDNLPKILTCDVRKLPFADRSFDLIISDSTLDHYNNKADIFLSLQELKRVLSPGGTLVITMDNGGNITEPLFRLWIHLGLAPFYIGKTYSIRELKKSLEEIGLGISDETAIMHNPRFFTKMGVRLVRLLRGDRGSPPD